MTLDRTVDAGEVGGVRNQQDGSLRQGAPAAEPAPRSSVLVARALRAARWLPVALLVLAWSVGLAVADVMVPRAGVMWALVPTSLLLAVRLVLELRIDRVEPGSRPLLWGFGLHAGLLLVATWLNPLTCIYAFVGYFDAERFFRGRQLTVVLPVTALICALGQAGGPPGLTGAPVLFAALAVLNLGVASAMSYLGAQRERQVVAREQAAEELTRVHRQNVALQEELMEQARTSGIAQERARISQEIHDTVAQGLVGVIRQLEALPAGLDGDVAERVLRAEQSARNCLLEARRAVQAMGPHQLEHATLVEALAELVAGWARTHRVVTELDADEAAEPVGHGHELLRVAQEGLSNIARHAGASSVRLRLHATATEEILELADDGGGFDPATVRRGRGLDGMAERLRAIGGELEVCSAPGRGTTITARAPRDGAGRPDQHDQVLTR